MLTRRNTITGRLYSEEPGIVAWELANEPRCEIPGGRELLLDWVAEMSAFVKQLDETICLRSATRASSTGAVRDISTTEPMASISKPFWRSIPSISVRTISIRSNWGLSGNLEFASQWIADHIAAGNRANKPVVLEEYGIKIDGRAVRSARRTGSVAGHLASVRSRSGRRRSPAMDARLQ